MLYLYRRREYEDFDREPKQVMFSKSPDGFSNRWGTCPWREPPSEMKYALTLELCKWAVSDSQQMCLWPGESPDPLQCGSIQGSHCPSSPTWEGRDGAGGNALFPSRNGREMSLCQTKDTLVPGWEWRAPNNTEQRMFKNHPKFQETRYLC